MAHSCAFPSGFTVAWFARQQGGTRGFGQGQFDADAGTAFAAILLPSTRDPLFRSLFVAWGTVIPTALVQGAFASGDVGVTLAFATVFANNAAFAQLLAAVTEVSVPWRRLLIILALGVAGSLVAMAAGAPFAASALPTAIAVAAPSLLVGYHVIRLRWPTLHAQGRALGTRGSAYDITARKAAERELRKSEAMLEESQRVARIGKPARRQVERPQFEIAGLRRSGATSPLERIDRRRRLLRRHRQVADRGPFRR